MLIIESIFFSSVSIASKNVYRNLSTSTIRTAGVAAALATPVVAVIEPPLPGVQTLVLTAVPAAAALITFSYANVAREELVALNWLMPRISFN